MKLGADSELQQAVLQQAMQSRHYEGLSPAEIMQAVQTAVPYGSRFSRRVGKGYRAIAEETGKAKSAGDFVVRLRKVLFGTATSKKMPKKNSTQS